MRTALTSCTKLSLFALTLLVLMGLLAGCTSYTERQNQALLSSVAKAVENDPERALSELEGIDVSLLNDYDYAYFTLLQVRTLGKTGVNVTPFEGAIVKARDLFVSKSDAAKAAYASYVTAYVYVLQGSMVKAMHNYLLADEWAGKADYTIPDFLCSIIQYNIALLHSYDKRYDESLEYLYRALSLISKEQGSYIDKLYAYELMGLDYQHLNQADSSLYYYEKALEIADTYNDAASRNRVLYNQCLQLYNTKEYKYAEDKINEQLLFSIQTNDSIATGMLYMTLARICAKTNRIDSAIDNIYKSKGFLANAKDDIRLLIYELLYRTMQQNGESAKAVHSLQQYNILKAEVERKRSAELAELQVEKDKQLIRGEGAHKTLLATADSRHAVQQERKNMRMLLAALGVVCLGVSAVLYYRKVKERKNTRMQLKEDLLLTISHLQSLNMVTEELNRLNDLMQKRNVLDMLDDAITIAKMPQQLYRRYGKLYHQLRLEYPKLTRAELELCWLARTQLLTSAETMRYLGLTPEQFGELWKTMNEKVGEVKRRKGGINGLFVNSDDLGL